MGKSYSNLWPQVVNFENLYQSFKLAARGKRGKASAADFEYDLESNLLELQTELCTGAYQPGEYRSFVINDPKRRLISAAPFRDRVVHHALCRVIEPLFERKFIFDSYANRIGKGSHRALDRCTQYLHRFKYVLPMDVQQYFPSIDHALLLGILSKTIADPEVLKLCKVIIASGKDVLDEKFFPVLFPGDDLTALLRPRGLPIGNLTSQFWANVYLNSMDHFIKRTLKCRGYIRYVDDMLLFSNDKSDLHRWRSEVIHYLAGLRLTIHENNAQPRPTRCGIPFLGFQVFEDHRRLKRRKAVYARRRLKEKLAAYQSGEIDQEKFEASVNGWIAHASHGDTWGLRRAVLSEIVL